MSNNIDLNNPPANYGYKVTLDREETLGELRVRLVKDLGLFVFALVSVGAVYWLCYNTVTSPTAGADEKKWAMSMLSATAAGACRLSGAEVNDGPLKRP